MLRWGWLAVGAISMVGCECGPQKVDCTDTTISFETPTAGQTVDSPFDVAISVRAPDGATFAIDAATLKVGSQTLDATTVSGNRATFAGLTAAAGSVTLTPSIAKGSCSKPGEPITVTVRDACSTPQVTRVDFLQDQQAPIGVLNRNELPDGTPLEVTVRATCVGDDVQVRILRGGAVVGALTRFTNGSATVVTSLPDSDSARYDLFAELVRNGQPVNTAETNPNAATFIQVNRVLPALALTTKAVFGPSDDVDSGASGLQIRVTGTAPANVGCRISVDDLPAIAALPTMGEVSADFTVASGSHMATLACVDSANNTASVTKGFIVVTAPPSVEIVSPSANPDGGRSVVAISPLPVEIRTDAAANSPVRAFRIAGTNRVPVANGVVSSMGTALLNVPFSTDGLFEVEVEVEYPVLNVGRATRSLDVALTGCGMGFSLPSVCPAYVRQNAYTFQTQSKTACSGQSARLTRSPVQADGGLGAATQVGMAALATNGTAGFATTNTDGTYLFRAEVDNVGADAGVSFAECEVLFDTSRPTFTSPTPPTTGAFSVTQTQDTQAAVPGAQRSIGYSAVVPSGGHVELCISAAALAPTGAADCPGGPTGWKVLSAALTSGQVVTLPEGQYAIKLVVVGTAVTVDSLPLDVNVDVTAPCVSLAGVSLPQDMAPADGMLNAAEVDGGVPRIAFALDPVCGTASSAVVRAVTSNAVGTTAYSASVTPIAASATIDLAQNVASTASLDLVVVLTDSAGNTNVFRGLTQNVTARSSFAIDRDVPSCAVTQPTKVGTLNTLDLTSAGAGQYSLTAAASTSADVSTVSFQLGSGTAVSANVTNLAASHVFGVSGTQAAQTLTVRCADAAQNAAQAQRSLEWDLEPPTCSIVAPASNSSFTTNDITTTVNVTGAAGRPVSVRSSLQTTDVGALTVSATSATGVLSYPNGSQTVTAAVSDAAGNPCTATSTAVVVNSASCSLTLTTGYVNGSTVWMNRANTTTTGATTATATIQATSSNCGSGYTVTLARTSPSASVIGTQATASGAVSFANVSLVDGESYTLSIDNGAGLLTTRAFSVDLVAPTVGGATWNGGTMPAIDVFFVAPTNNRRLETNTPGYYADGDGSAAGAQFSLAVNAIGGAFQGSTAGFVEATFKGTQLAGSPVSVSSSAANVSLPLTLPQADTGVLAIRVVDQAGNPLTVFSQNATIDVIAPDAPTVSRTLSTARGATVTLQWEPVYDDGTASGSGNVFDYDVRWSTSSTFGNNQMTTAADYFGSSSFRESGTTPSTTTMSRVLTLPPLNTYYIAVRARDELENYSPYTAPAPVDNGWARVTLSGTAGSAFGSTVVAGTSLNNDTNADLVVAAASVSLAGSVQVFYGGGGFTAQTSCAAPACTLITAPDAVGVNFGSDLSIAGNLGDSAGEGKPDLVIGQTGYPTSAGEGRVFVYFGSATAAAISPSTFIEIRGSTTLTTLIGAVVKIIDDIDGDNLSELLITAPAYNSNLGRMFIFKGRTVAQWQAARTATDGTTMAPYIPVGSADWIIEGPNPAYTTASNYFGRLKFGVTSIGDITGDGRAEFTTGMGRSTVNRVQIFSGGSVAAAASPMLNSVGLQTFLPPEGVGTDTNNVRGFGSAVLGGYNLTNAATKDVAVSWIARPGGGAVYIYADPTSLGVPTSPSLTLEGPLLFGSQISAGNLNADATADLVVGVDTTTSASAYILWNRAGSFDTPVGSGTPRFWYSRIDGATLAGSTSTSLGRWNAVADLNADTNLDIVLADQQNSAVHVFR